MGTNFGAHVFGGMVFVAAFCRIAQMFLGSGNPRVDLLLALGWACVIPVEVQQDDSFLAGFAVVITATHVLIWWFLGGGDDFRKRRRRLGAKAKALFKKIKNFRPKPIRVPVPVGT